MSAGVVGGLYAAGERAARQGLYAEAKARTEAIERQQGIAAKPGTTASTPAEAAKNIPGHSGLLHDFANALPGGEAGLSLAEEATSGLESLGIPTPNSLAKEAASEVAGDVVNLVKPVATKLVLYAVLIFGGIAMIIFGVGELLKPVGGPDLKRAAGSLVKRSGEAAAAA